MSVHLFGAKRDTEESARKAQAIVESIAKNTAASVCLDILGPMAKTFAEFMERQQALEDSLWYCANPECRVVTFGERDGVPCSACGRHGFSRLQYRYVPKAPLLHDVTGTSLGDHIPDGAHEARVVSTMAVTDGSEGEE